jgi:hypothetical protein
MQKKSSVKSAPKATREVALPGVVAEGETATVERACGCTNQLNPPDTFP